MYFINNDSAFPPVHLADAQGLLCIGGNLDPERLLLAYRNGIFPWYHTDEPVCWYSPDPRFVLFPRHLKINKTIKALLKKDAFQFTVNKDFAAVIHHCATVHRPTQPGTWIHPEIIDAYTSMHKLGYAQSAEVWQEGRLVGGLYGIRINGIFFGESMFSLVSNASRYAFTCFVKQLEQEGIVLVDCQVYTAYLESMGAAMIEREKFLNLLRQFT